MKGALLRWEVLTFKGLQVADEDGAPIDFQHSFGLQAREIPGNQFADCAYLCCQFLVGNRQSDFHTLRSALAGILGEAQKVGSKPMAHRGEGQFFNDSYQASKTRAYNPQDLEGYLGVSETESLEFLLAYEEQGHVVHRYSRRGICSSIEDRYLGDRTTRTVYTEYLFAPVRGTFEYTNISRLNNIKPRARFAFAKYRLARCVMARSRMLGKEIQLAFCQPGEDGNLRQRLPRFMRGVRHGGYCTRAPPS
jgi:hypothetical protein